MRAQQDKTLPNSRDAPTKMMKSGRGDTKEISHLQSKVKGLENDIKILRDSMDVMASDIATSEALTGENQKAKEKAEWKCLELAQQVKRLSMTLQDHDQHQSGKESRSERRAEVFAKGTQTEIPKKPTMAGIEEPLRLKFRQREAELMKQCQKVKTAAEEYRRRTESAEMLLHQAENTIDGLQKKSNKQLAILCKLLTNQGSFEEQLSND